MAYNVILSRFRARARNRALTKLVRNHLNEYKNIYSYVPLITTTSYRQACARKYLAFLYYDEYLGYYTEIKKELYATRLDAIRN